MWSGLDTLNLNRLNSAVRLNETRRVKTLCVNPMSYHTSFSESFVAGYGYDQFDNNQRTGDHPELVNFFPFNYHNDYLLL